MEKSFLLRRGLAGLLLVVFFLPVLHLLWRLPAMAWSWDPFFLTVIKGATVQALLSSLITLALGFWGGLGLISLRSWLSRPCFGAISLLVLLPAFLPPIMVVLVTTGALGWLPTGLLGVLFFHVSMNVGLVSLLFLKILENRWQGLIAEAQVMAVPYGRFLLKGLIPCLWVDLRGTFIFLFMLFFFSFSIPLLVGGTQYSGVESFIFEKVLFDGRWGEAIYYSLGLFLCLFTLAWLLDPVEAQRSSQGKSSLDALPWLQQPLGLLGAVGPGFFLIGALIGLSLFKVIPQWSPALLISTLQVGLLTGLLCFLLLSFIGFIFLKGIFRQTLFAMTNPGWVMMGFSFLLFPGTGPVVGVIKLSIALSLLFVPFLFRLDFSQGLRELEKQVQVAETFGVGWWRIYCQVIFPQSLPRLGFLSGLAAVWAAGDFGLSEIILSEANTGTLALEMKTLLANYRLEKALSLLPSLVLASLTLFVIFQGFNYVAGPKIPQKTQWL